jgi:Family of unknown function (DUF5946)
MKEIVCPGCGLAMPQREGASCHTYFNCSPECWSVFTEVLAAEFNNAFLFGRVHQLTVDAYATQHSGGKHPDKSLDIHLCGLHLVLQRGVAPTSVPPLLQQLASNVREWPHFSPPSRKLTMTVLDIALSSSVEDHISNVRSWANLVWQSWDEVHDEIASFALPFAEAR